MKRLALVVLIALALAPGTWIRPPLPPFDHISDVHIIEFDVANRNLGALQVERAWQLSSPNDLFGGYSAMVYLGGGKLLLGNDWGAAAFLSLRGPLPRVITMVGFPEPEGTNKSQRDLESLTHDPATGTIWAGYEGSNSIRQMNSGLQIQKIVSPSIMSGWSNNSGPEAFARLSNGTFIVLSEGGSNANAALHDGVLFAGDPTTGATTIRFSFRPPSGFRPVDMVQQVDGSVLILVRKLAWGLLPHFETAIVRADPAKIAKDAVWSGDLVAILDDAQYRENYEGLAIVTDSGAEGIQRGDILVLSDDNASQFQRTLMLQLRWKEIAR